VLTTLLYLHLASTLIMVGVIWVIQLVHYPLFELVGRDNFVAYERSHTVRIGLIVMPTMLIEAATAIGLLVLLDGERGGVALIGAILLALIWSSTALLQVPCHERLAVRFDDGAWRRLVRTNWIRTVAWSARGVLAVAMISMV
jgi:hypothetical protein